MPPLEPISENGSAPASPYTASQLALRSLTMPPVPNLSIPPSPPGSPPLSSNAKIARFLELKKRGTHFNQRLENSSALRNPGWLEQSTAYAGISGDEQYVSSLAEEDGLGVPKTWPEWAYLDGLNKSQVYISKRKEEKRARGQREAIDFVPAATSNTSARTSRSGTPASRSSTADRVMAGLEKEVKSGKAHDSGKRKSRFDVVDSGHSGRRSRSPRSKRVRDG